MLVLAPYAGGGGRGEVEEGPLACRNGFIVDASGGGDVLQGCPSGIKDEDFIGIFPGRLPIGHDLAELCVDLLRAHQSGINGVVQFTDANALIEEIDDDFASGQQLGRELLLVRAVRADSANECAGGHHLSLEESGARSGAGQDDVALARCAG
jgi:hypothetical protein